MENPFKIDDLRVPLFLETSISQVGHRIKHRTGQPITFFGQNRWLGTDTNFGRLLKGLQINQCRDCAIYFFIIVLVSL